MATMPEQVQHIDQVITATKVVVQGGAVTSVGSSAWIWLGNNHESLASLGVVVGIVIGVFGYLTGLWFQRKRLKIYRDEVRLSLQRKGVTHD